MTIEERPTPEAPEVHYLPESKLCAELGMQPTPHPLIPWLSDTEIRDLLETPGGEKELVEIYTDREALIADSEQNAWECGFKLIHWKDADVLLRDERYKVVYLAGGIRASKSEYAARESVDVVLTYACTDLWALQDNRDSSINNQQRHIWKYLPKEIKALNRKKHPVASIRYDLMNGFSSGSSNNAGKIVLPNRSTINFLTYNQDPDDYQGGEVGVREAEFRRHPNGPPNIGAWADENMSWKWYETIRGRAATRDAKVLWTFSPRFGITQTIKELIDGAQTIKSRFAELLSTRVNVPGLPIGHMPYISLNDTKKVAICYFHGELNPFGNWPNVRDQIKDTTAQNIMERGYGYTLRTKGRCFPKCSEVNLIKPEHLPAEGTNYMITDPAGKRNYATIWVRITPGKRPSAYIYREWPDQRRYGEWAVPSTNPNRLDGDPGPAQQTLGYGVLQYKRLWKDLETIKPGHMEKDPQRAAVQATLSEEPAEKDDAATTEQKSKAREPIRMRYVDPRAGKNQHIAERGGTSIIDLFYDRQRDGSGKIVGESIHLEPASGVEEEEGIGTINDWFNWDEEQDLCAGVNAPRLYISEDCANTFWCLMNYTGNDGQKAACKDFVDLVRYAIMSDLTHTTGSQLKTKSKLKTY